MRTACTPSTGSRAPVWQAAIHGKSSHKRQGDWSANKTGVASCPWATIAPGGQSLIQSPHRVHRSRNSVSSTAPGGRNQSFRDRGGLGGGGASTALENSRAAFATERRESLRKSRRPYAGSAVTGQSSGFNVHDQSLSPAAERFALPPRLSPTSLHRHAACTPPHNGRRPRIPHPNLDDSPEYSPRHRVRPCWPDLQPTNRSESGKVDRGSLA